MAETSEKQRDFTEQNGEFDLPQYLLEKYDSSQQVQLIRGYRLLQVLKYHPSNEPFFEKPDNAARAGRSYYDVIKSPMWLNEIKRKFFSAEYNSLLEVVKDIRLIFENCYYFWGPKSPFTQICLQMEQLFEGRVAYLPKELRNICSLEETHDINEDEIVTKAWSRCRSKGKTCSRLMLRTLRRKRNEESEEYSEKMNLSKFCDNGDRILRWEERLLCLSFNQRFISSSRELPQIGQFIRLVSDTNLPNVYQFDVERMLFFPQYSSLFQRIMSSIFSDDRSENSLRYEEIREKIESTVANWFESYEAHDRSASKVSESEGIDGNFFDITGDVNPLSSQHYEDLPYCIKVTILKSIFDHICHCRSDVNRIIGNKIEESFFPQKIGRDKCGYVYVFFPIFPDIRVYKYKPKLTTVNKSPVTTSTDNDDDTDEKSLKKVFDDVGSRFKMVADSVEGVRAILDELFFSDVENSKKDFKMSNSKIIEALQQFEERFAPDEDERIRRVNETRVELFNEWLKNCKSEEQLVTLDQPSDDEHSDLDENYGDEDCDSIESSKKLTSVIFEDVTNPKAIKMRIGNRVNSECFDVKRGISETGECDSTESICKYEEGETTEESLGGFSSSPVNETDAEEKTEDDENHELKTEEVGPTEKVFEDINRDDENEMDEEDTYHDSGGDDIENAVKPEPMEEENIDDYCNFENENNSADSQQESNDYSRLRQSSGTFYPPVVDENFEEEDSSSSEETSTSDEDSDDDWEVQNKRSRTKVNKRMRKQTTRANDDVPNKRNRLDESSIADTDSNKDVVDSEETKNDPQPNEGETEELKIKLSDTENDKAPKESDKRPSKIKVIDLAKLKNFENENRVNKMELMNHRANSFIVQRRPVGPATMNMASVFNPMQMTNAINYPTNLQARQMMPQSMTKNYSPSRMQNVSPMRSAQRAIEPSIFGAQVNARNTNISPAFRGVNTSSNVMPREVPNVNYGQPTRMMSNVYGQSTRGRNVPGVIPIPQMSSSVTVLRNMVQNRLQRRPLVREIDGMIGIHSNGGVLQYVVNLANGSHVPLTTEQVQKLRQGNGGVLPQRLKIPVPADVADKIEPCVVLDE